MDSVKSGKPQKKQQYVHGLLDETGSVGRLIDIEGGFNCTAMRYFDTVCSESGRARTRELLTFLHQHPTDRFLIHCSLGKDRTGVVIALLLALLGASDAQIADDFALSGPGLAPMSGQIVRFVEEFSPGCTEAELAEAVAQMLAPDRQAMLIMLQMVRQEFGGAMEFFRDACDVDSGVLLALRSALTVPCDRNSGRKLRSLGARTKGMARKLSASG